MAFSVAALIIAGFISVTNANIGSSENRGLLYPHMANNGDTELSAGDDVYDKMRTYCKYHLYGTGSHQLHVGSNGFVTFPNGRYEYIPKNMCMAPSSSEKMIAPLWSDNYPPAPNAVGSHVWYREEMGQDLLDRAQKDIQETFNNGCDTASFVPKCLFIVTWQRQESFCDNFQCCWGPTNGKKRRDTDSTEDPIKEERNATATARSNNPTNYYQMVWATDDHDSYAIFNYLKINWWNCYDDYARAGFFDYNNGSPKCAELPYSGAGNVNLLEFTTNSNNMGRWVHRTDKALIKEPDCSNLPESQI